MLEAMGDRTDKSKINKALCLPWSEEAYAKCKLQMAMEGVERDIVLVLDEKGNIDGEMGERDLATCPELRTMIKDRKMKLGSPVSAINFVMKAGARQQGNERYVHAIKSDGDGEVAEAREGL